MPSEHHQGDPIIDPDGERYEEPGYGPDKADFHDEGVEEPDADAYAQSESDWTADEPGLTLPVGWKPGQPNNIGDYVETAQQDVPPEETYSVPSTNVDEEDADD